MKKLIAMLIVGAVLISGVVGCGGTPSSKPASTTDKDKDKKMDKDKDKS